MARNARKMFNAGLAVLLLCVAGCVTVPKPPAPLKPSVAAREPGVYHTVKRGETLWRISKMYGSEVDRIVAANKIPNASRLEVGQRLFIPGSGKRTMSFAGGSMNEDFIWPVIGTVESGFGQLSQGMVNKGINIVPGNDRSVKASRSGNVVFYNDDFLNMGNIIVLDHGDGFFTVYGRVIDVSVKPGDQVPQGAQIAQVPGARHSFIHFEIRKGVVSQNPNFYLSK